MPRKCDSCKYLGSSKKLLSSTRVEFCKNPNTASDQVVQMFPERHGVPLNMARSICDREGDGVFVYFEQLEVVNV